MPNVALVVNPNDLRRLEIYFGSYRHVFSGLPLYSSTTKSAARANVRLNQWLTLRLFPKSQIRVPLDIKTRANSAKVAAGSQYASTSPTQRTQLKELSEKGSLSTLAQTAFLRPFMGVGN